LFILQSARRIERRERIFSLCFVHTFCWSKCACVRSTTWQGRLVCAWLTAGCSAASCQPRTLPLATARVCLCLRRGPPARWDLRGKLRTSHKKPFVNCDVLCVRRRGHAFLHVCCAERCRACAGCRQRPDNLANDQANAGAKHDTYRCPAGHPNVFPHRVQDHVCAHVVSDSNPSAVLRG
jgi:hypothetical protein